ncbi:MAG: hypothetical protein IJV31_10980 [Clostridia bacterium]|nr:hypothetical protein [Clostridia bacterium]
MSSKDNIYFSREEYNKLMQIINDNKNSKNKEIKQRAEQLSEKFEKYVYLHEKQTEEKLEEGINIEHIQMNSNGLFKSVCI